MPLSKSLYFSPRHVFKVEQARYPSYCQVDLSKTSGRPQERATVQNNVLGMACLGVLCICALPSMQILDGTLPGSHCGILVCVFVCVDVSLLEPACWVAWWCV